jgi:hypothetical protein
VGDGFTQPLSGLLSVSTGSKAVFTSTDIRMEIERGEQIKIDGSAYTVDTDTTKVYNHRQLPLSTAFSSSNGESSKSVAGHRRKVLKSALPIPVQKWVHVAIVNTGRGLGRMYIDGILVSEALQDTLASQTRVLNYLATGSDSNYFIGQLDEFHLWSLAITESEINSIMHCGIANAMNNLPPIENLVFGYSFNFTDNPTVNAPLVGTYEHDLSNYNKRGHVYPGVERVVSTRKLPPGHPLSTELNFDTQSSLHIAYTPPMCEGSSLPSKYKIEWEAAEVRSEVQVVHTLDLGHEVQTITTNAVHIDEVQVIRTQAKIQPEVQTITTTATQLPEIQTVITKSTGFVSGTFKLFFFWVAYSRYCF